LWLQRFSKIQEGNDLYHDYSAGRIRILNQALLASGQAINVKLENNELFVAAKIAVGTRLDYHLNDKGIRRNHDAPYEQPITQNEIRRESISNTIWGFDANYKFAIAVFNPFG